MLRFEYMPSDFNPMLLFLGESVDLESLASLLKDFQENPRRIGLRSWFVEAEGRSEVDLVFAEGLEADYGMRAAPSEDHFLWILNAWQAGQVALRIEAVASREVRSGNDILELGIQGEIPVKVSRGEFTDDFLTPQHDLYSG